MLKHLCLHLQHSRGLIVTFAECRYIQTRPAVQGSWYIFVYKYVCDTQNERKLTPGLGDEAKKPLESQFETGCTCALGFPTMAWKLNSHVTST